MSEPFTNWSGLVKSPAAEVRRIASEDDARAAVLDAASGGRPVRVAGTLHSHAPLVQVERGMILLTDDLAGNPRVDAGQAVARIPGGTKLSAIGEPLWQCGYSLANQGDIDLQSIAGLIGTGVHGTGPSLASISEAVTGGRIVTADGDIVDTDTEPELLEALRLNLGVLGVVTEVRLRLVPAYHLHAREWTEAIAAVMERLDELVAQSRHFLFFWYPGTDTAKCRRFHPCAGPPHSMGGIAGERIDRAYRIFPGERSTPHTEMEYSVPAQEGPACFARIRTLMLEEFPEVERPVEYRTVAGDNGWLSPARGRATVAISIHQDADREHVAYFRAAESIFREHGGRPHWGKVHYLAANELAAEYPEHWEQFWAVRDRLDPSGRFLNAHLRTIGGL